MSTDNLLKRFKGRRVTIKGQDFIIRDFWVVITAKLLRLVEVEQLAELHVQSKWFWRDEDFLEKIMNHSSHVKLGGECPQDVRGAFESGERLFGCWVEGDIDAFPVNVDRMFKNQIGNYERLNTWTRFERDKGGLVSIQQEFNVKVEYKALNRSYPFDRLAIPLKLNMRQSRTSSDGPSVTWCLRSSVLDNYPDKFKEDVYPINSSRSALTFLNEEPPLLDYRKFDDKPPRPVLCLLFERNPAYFLTSIVLPLFLIVLACLSVFLLDTAGATEQHATMITGFLTVAAYKTAIQTQLPTTSITTFADWYILSCFGFLILALAKTIALDNASMSQEASRGDDVSTWLLIGIWAAWNFLLLSELVLDKFAVSRLFYKQWETIVEDACKEPKEKYLHSDKTKTQPPK